MNAVGFVQLGVRPYDPIRRAFMAADSLGHDADAGLNTAFGGNPAAFFDPDGRDWKQIHDQVAQTDWQTFNGEEIFGTPWANPIYNQEYVSFWVRSPDGAISLVHATPNEFLAGAYAPDTSFGTWAANTFFNSDNIKNAWSEFTQPDFSSGWGVATWVDSGISLVANTADAAANAIPIVGTAKSAVEDVGKAGVKAVVGAFTKNATEDAAKVEGEQFAKDLAEAGTKEVDWWEKTAYTPTDFQGTRVYQRNDLFDPNLITMWTENGEVVAGSNIERMESGLAPIGYDGQSVNLHHTIQTDDSPIAEVSASFHQENYDTLHINTGDLPSGIDRSAFGQWRASYWMNRANDFK